MYARHAEFDGQHPFDLPAVWLERQSRLDMAAPVNFVCTVDSTGGNSGSPLINQKRELVGLLFDGNIESLANEFLYGERVERSVCVHPRAIEEALARIYDAIRSAASPAGSNAYNTTFFIGWDEPGGTYDHVPPGPVPPPDPSAPAGQMGFKFDRSGYRVPAILVSPWIPQGSVFNDEYRHTSLIATLRKSWDLGEALTQRDASARTFDALFTLDEPRDPQTWATVTALPVPASHLDEEALAKGLSALGKTMGRGIIEQAKELGVKVPAELDKPDAGMSPEVIDLFREVAWDFFPLLAPEAARAGHASNAEN